MRVDCSETARETSDDSRTLLSRLPDQRQDPEADSDAGQALDTLRTVLSCTLTESELLSVQLKYGLGDLPPMTYGEIAAHRGCTQKAAHAEVLRALRKLKRPDVKRRMSSGLSSLCS